MKFKVALNEFRQALAIVIKTVGTDSHGHQGLKIYASKKTNRIKLTTTDGFNATEMWVDAAVSTAGKAVIGGDKLKKYIEKLDVEKMDISTKDNGSILLKTTRGQQTFVSYDANSFPVLPKFKASLSFDLSGKVYKEMINSVAFCTRKEEKGSPSDKLQGINMVSDGKVLSLYTTDGIRVAAYQKKLKSLSSQEMDVILPKRALTISSQHVKDDERVAIQGMDGRFIIKIGAAIYHAPILAGKFPSVGSIIKNKMTGTRFTADRIELLGLLERSAIILESKHGLKGTLQIAKNRVTLKGQVEDSHFDEHITVNGDGNNLDVRFDIGHLRDIIKNVGSDTIRIDVQESKPIRIRPEDHGEQTCLLAIG